MIGSNNNSTLTSHVSLSPIELLLRRKHLFLSIMRSNPVLEKQQRPALKKPDRP
jgi:hypothetical protein